MIWQEKCHPCLPRGGLSSKLPFFNINPDQLWIGNSLAIIFGTVLVNELGDRTQLATLLFAANKEVNKWMVFAAASPKLVATSALGALDGGFIARYVNEKVPASDQQHWLYDDAL